jgi:hypothetical protein
VIGSRYADCFTCKHLDRTATRLVCAAFPDGVPDPIARGQVGHDRPYPGDKGIRHELADAFLPPARKS